MDNTKILEQINKLIEKTKENKIPWKSSSSNLVRWIKQENERSLTVTLQMQQMGMIINRALPMTQRENKYVFTIQATNPNEVILQINTMTIQDSEYNESLEKLFNEAMIISKGVSVDAISKLLQDL